MTTKYRGQPRYSRDVCDLMRRINRLEHRARPEGIWQSTYAQTEWVGIGPATPLRNQWFSSMYHDGEYLHAVRGSQVEKYDLNGNLVGTTSVTGVGVGVDFYYRNGVYRVFRRSDFYPVATYPSLTGSALQAVRGVVLSGGGEVIFRVNADEEMGAEAILSFPSRTISTIGDGDGELQLDTASALAVDRNDNVYLANGGRIQKFSSDGAFVKTWPVAVTGWGGGRPEYFLPPMMSCSDTGIYIIPVQDAWVFDPTGVYKYSYEFSSLFEIQAPIFNRDPNYHMYHFGLAVSLVDRIYTGYQERMYPSSIFYGGIDVCHEIAPDPFKSYPAGGAPISLGEDGGYDLPELEALTPERTNSMVTARIIQDMRDRVQAMATDYTSSVYQPGDSQTYAFNWREDDAKNLYNLAVDRADYQFTTEANMRGYDWWRSYETMTTGPRTRRKTFDIDIGEIDDCVTKLENSFRTCA